jgi:hypothetical protein
VGYSSPKSPKGKVLGMEGEWKGHREWTQSANSRSAGLTHPQRGGGGSLPWKKVSLKRRGKNFYWVSTISPALGQHCSFTRFL